MSFNSSILSYLGSYRDASAENALEPDLTIVLRVVGLEIGYIVSTGVQLPLSYS